MYRIALILLMVLVSGGTFAGTTSAQNLELGVWGGYTRSNEFTTDFLLCVRDRCAPSAMSHHFWRHAPVAGVLLRQERTERLAARAEMALVQKGYGPGDERSDWRVASQYLEFPLLAEVHLLRIGSARLQLTGGFAPAVLLSCQVSGTTVNGFVTANCGELNPITDESYGPSVSFDFGWVVAPGLRFPLHHGSLLLEVRHTGGLVDIRPDGYGHTANQSTAISLASTWRVRSLAPVRN